jgi:hypothetical protein
MSEQHHWNIQVSVQRVTEGENLAPVARGVAPKTKSVLQVADIKVQAETETEAYAKVRRLLDAAQSPASYGVLAPPEAPKYPVRAIRDNPQA